jgi:hypothetical protein
MNEVSTAERAGRRMRGHFRRLATTPQFAAVVECVFDLRPRRAKRAFAELCLLDGRLLFARAEGDTTFRHFVGRRDQLEINLLGFVTHLGLGEDERAYVLGRIDAIPVRLPYALAFGAPVTPRPTLGQDHPGY